MRKKYSSFLIEKKFGAKSKEMRVKKREEKKEKKNGSSKLYWTS
jgi:hypothetical protein